MKIFKFLNEKLQKKLISLLRKKAKNKFKILPSLYIEYDEKDVDLIENQLICSVRVSVFPNWQIVTASNNSFAFQMELQKRKVSFELEIKNFDIRFLINKKYKPHAWKIDYETHNSF